MNAILLLVAMLGQCSGGVCPTPMTFSMPMQQFQATLPVSIQAPTVDRTRAWHSTLNPDGSTSWVWGWREGDQVAFYRSEQPPADPRPSKPTAAVLAPSKAEPKPVATVEPVTIPPKIAPAPDPPAPAPAPAPAPTHVVGALPAFATTGVDRSKLALVEGYQTSHAEGQRFIETIHGDTRVPDDRNKPHLTVIGSPEDTAPVMAALKGSGPLSKLAPEMHVQAYEPDSAYVKGLGFQTGKPSITLQVGSKVVHRQLDFEGGERALVSAIEKSGALRKADPNYQPDKDPDLRKSAPIAGIEIETYGPAVAVFAALAFAFLYRSPSPKAS